MSGELAAIFYYNYSKKKEDKHAVKRIYFQLYRKKKLLTIYSKTYLKNEKNKQCNYNCSL